MNALKAGLVATVVAGSIGMVTATTGCEGTAQARQIFMALDGQGYRPRDTFYPDTTTIYCDVWFSAANNDETVDVSIVQTKGEDPLYSGTGVNEGAFVPVDRLWAAGEQAPNEGLSIVGFVLDPPQLTSGGGPAPFAVGDYECRVTVNGQSAGSAPFHIVYPDPDCPVGGLSGAANKTLSCMGNHAGAQCPSDEQYGNPTACTCPSIDQVGGDPTLRMWVCP